LAARFYVEESAHGPVLRSVRRASPRAVNRPPITQMRPALIPPRRTAANAPATRGGSAFGSATRRQGTAQRSPSSRRSPPTRRASLSRNACAR
jgi:hypothetical protein